DDDADLVRLDLHRGDARSKAVDVGAGLRQHLDHLAQNVQPALARLIERPLQHASFVHRPLDAPLDIADSVLGAEDLELHYTSVVFVTPDVAQDRDATSVADQTHRDVGDGLTDGHTAIHHAERSATHARHRARPVRLQHLADDADRVRKLLMARHHARHGALGERPMTYFTAAWTTQRLRLAGAERREVVVQHEALPALAGERVDLLLVGRGAQRGGHHGLRLTALEQRRSVRARQQAHLASDGSNR